jgi:hypothetical protein
MRFWLAALSWRSFCTRTFTAALAIALLLATPCQSQTAGPEPKRVLMLHSFGPRFKPWSDYEQSIRSEISQQWHKPVDFIDHSLVNAGQDDESSEAAFIEYLRVGRLISLSPSARPPPISSSAIASGCFPQRQWSLRRWSSAGSNTRS